MFIIDLFRLGSGNDSGNDRNGYDRSLFLGSPVTSLRMFYFLLKFPSTIDHKV